MNEKMSQKIIDEKLALLKYKSDVNSHIEVDNEICSTCKTKDCLNVCPAKVYKLENGEIKINYENCLECGACYVACPKKSINWVYPKSDCGVVYKYS